MADTLSSDADLIDWIDQNNVTVSASPQRGYKNWHIIHLNHSTDAWLLAERHDSLREALDHAKRRFDATGGVRPDRAS